MFKQVFLGVGRGGAVHHGYLRNGDAYTNCGAEGVGNAQLRLAISQLREVAGPATCKRCLAMAAKAERRAAP